MNRRDHIYDLHCHTNAASACSSRTPEQLVRAHHAAGYQGLVLTDHSVRGNTCVPHRLPLEEQMEVYLSAYERAVQAAEPLDMDVFLGFEIGLAAHGACEVLIYGLTPAFCRTHPTLLYPMPLSQLAHLVHSGGGLVFQAHPFRVLHDQPRPQVLDPEILDGVEAFNGRNRPEEDEEAAAFAAAHGLLLSSGSDDHDGLDRVTNGIRCRRLTSEAELVYALTHPKERDLLSHGETVKG